MRRRLINVAVILLALFAFSHARAALMPQCFPQILWSNVLSGSLPVAAVVDQVPASAGIPQYDYYAVWVCDVSTGYITYITLFQATDIAPVAWQYAVGKWTKAQADADCATTCVDPDSTVLAFQTPLLAKYRPVATVAGTADQPVYGLNADGSRNTAAVANVTATHGAPCNELVRLAGTAYFGIPAASLSAPIVSETPYWVYAICSVSFPIPPSPMPGNPSAPGGSILARSGGLVPQFFK